MIPSLPGTWYGIDRELRAEKDTNRGDEIDSEVSVPYPYKISGR